MKTKTMTIELPRGFWGRARVLAIRGATSEEDVVVRAVGKGLAVLEADETLDQMEAQRDGNA